MWFTRWDLIGQVVMDHIPAEEKNSGMRGIRQSKKFSKIKKYARMNR
jgi:hypothetical protein